LQCAISEERIRGLCFIPGATLKKVFMATFEKAGVLAFHALWMISLRGRKRSLALEPLPVRE